MKATSVAPSNIAFIKYWGRKDEILRLPENGSISMNLSNLLTTTTVEFSSKFEKDELLYNGVSENVKNNRAIAHIDRVRKLANLSLPVKIVTQNNFPSGTGLSSSASGFAALTLAATKAAGLKLSEKELSILARQGSGSACRSIPNGFVEWLDGDTSEESYAYSLYPKNYWDIVDVVAVVSTEFKEVSTSEGQKSASESKFFEARRKAMPEKIKKCKEILAKKDFEAFGELLESEALELHSIMLTSHPSLIYLLPETLRIMRLVKVWRSEGLSVYFTLNTGQNIHLIAQKKDEEKLVKKLEELPYVMKIIPNDPSDGARIIDSHLF
ncbi:MAG: diphosphomevalonate decarboxylase [Candidatus Levybacteria bacterium]|nr:diphosphomevalonate decarboxylase [Candidatus Levybacteria bacterium]